MCPCCQRSEKLFQDTPDDKKLCSVKEEVFEITDGGPIIDTDHPVIKEMFEIPITGALCAKHSFMNSNASRMVSMRERSVDP